MTISKPIIKNENDSKTLAQKYTKTLFEVFDKYGKGIKDEIIDMSKQGYVLIGYKGVTKERATKIKDIDLQVDESNKIKSNFGATWGEGFYLTPDFEHALDYAKDYAYSQYAKIG